MLCVCVGQRNNRDNQSLQNWLCGCFGNTRFFQPSLAGTCYLAKDELEPLVLLAPDFCHPCSYIVFDHSTFLCLAIFLKKDLSVSPQIVWIYWPCFR